MKKIFLFLCLATFSLSCLAQSELPADTSRLVLPSSVKEYGGFLLDMGLMGALPPRLPKFNLDMPAASRDYSQLFHLDNSVVYSRGLTSIFSSGYGLGFGLFSPSAQTVQMGTFKLKNGWTMSTYGDYDKDGFRVPNRSALPWERDNFRGAFELKSANGNFGIRIEVQQGRNGLY
ncbi:MAG: occludin [Mediterranea sp.]|jgi:hypothetical protein|nr:occludin [Mediterranea sp.]